MTELVPPALHPLELLDTDQVTAVHCYGVHHLISTVHFADRLGTLLTLLLSLLHSHNLAIFASYCRHHFTTVRGCLVKCLTKLRKLKFASDGYYGGVVFHFSKKHLSYYVSCRMCQERNQKNQK